MDQVQSFLYSEASRVLDIKEFTKSVTFSAKRKRSVFMNRSIYINRFDDSFKTSNIQAENYSSSIPCDVEQDKFWDFLYSKFWDDKFVLRVLPGELFTDLDICLNEMLALNKISRHITVAYLSVKNEEKHKKLQFDLNPKTIQVQFTYYRKSNPTSSSSISNNYFPFDFGSANSPGQKSASEDFAAARNSTCDDLFDTGSEKDFVSTQEVITSNILSQQKNAINISLEHFPCILSWDIENSIETESNVLENEIQGDHWTKERPTTEDKQLRSPTKKIMFTNALKKTDKKQTKSSGKITTFQENAVILKDESKENLLKPTSIDIDLTNLGKIMEREQALNFNEMSLKERKKFFLSDERLQKATRKVNAETPEQEQVEDLTRKKASKKSENITVIKDLNNFTTLVNGILENPAIYRTLVYSTRKKTLTKPTVEKIRSKHAHFIDDHNEEDDINIQMKTALFHSRHRRGLIKTFTYHPKMFSQQQLLSVFNTNRLQLSYTPDRYKKTYAWEKRRSTEYESYDLIQVSIPEFAAKKHTIDPEMLLKALDDFIVRKECVISSKGSNITSLTFIRPIYLKKLLF